MLEEHEATISRTYVLPQRPFLKTFPRLMEYGRLRPSFGQDDKYLQELVFERARRNKLRLAIVRFSRYADHQFDVEGFMTTHSMRHVDLVELALFTRAHGDDLPDGATLEIFGETIKFRDISRIPWYFPIVQRDNDVLNLKARQHFRGINAEARMLVAFK